MGQADRCREHKDHRRDQTRHHADAEKYNRGNKIDESRQGLHQIQNRSHPRIKPGPVGHRDANGNADSHTDHAGRQDQSQALGRFLPIALVDDEQKPKRHEERDLPTALQVIGQRHKQRDDDQRMGRLQQP